MRRKPKPKKLSAENLRGVLWDSIAKVRSGQMPVEEVTSIAASAREIMKSVKEERIVSMMTHGKPSAGFREFYGLNANARIEVPQKLVGSNSSSSNDSCEHDVN